MRTLDLNTGARGFGCPMDNRLVRTTAAPHRASGGKDLARLPCLVASPLNQPDGR